MMPTHVLWESIIKCNSPNDMNEECWGKLRIIAKNMIKTHYSDDYNDISGKKLIYTIEKDELNEIEDKILFYKRINFLYAFALEWERQNLIEIDERKSRRYKKQTIKNQYRGVYLKYKKVYDNGLEFGKKHLFGKHLRNTFYETIESLGIKTFQNYDGNSFPFVESLILFFCDDAHQDETPIQAYTRWRENHPTVAGEATES